jgi:hypothetical protein
MSELFAESSKWIFVHNLFARLFPNYYIHYNWRMHCVSIQNWDVLIMSTMHYMNHISLGAFQTSTQLLYGFILICNGLWSKFFQYFIKSDVRLKWRLILIFRRRKSLLPKALNIPLTAWPKFWQKPTLAAMHHLWRHRTTNCGEYIPKASDTLPPLPP